MKRFIVLPVLVLLLLGVQAQEKIRFEKITHEFPPLKLNDPAEYTFAFTNVSDKAVKLTSVKASCGCTTPAWTQEAIAPGKTGTIQVTYNTARSGPFHKSVTVMHDGSAEPTILYIKGNVEEGAPSVAFNHTIGGLAFDKISYNLPSVAREQVYTTEFNVKNISPIALKLGENVVADPAFDVVFDKAEIIPGQTAKISVSIHGSRFEKGGEFNKTLSFKTNEEEEALKTLTFDGKAEYTAAELNSQPNIVFENTSFKGGKVIEGEKVNYAFKFTNTGLGDLVIESVKASCGCTASAPKDKIVKGGQTSEIIASFDSRSRPGTQRKSITVTTNDPDQPVMVLSFEVEVESNPFQVGKQGPTVNNE